MQVTDRVSLKFEDIINSGRKPVIMQILPELNSGGIEQGCIDMNKAITDAGAQSIVVSNGGKRVPEILRHKGLHLELPVHSKNPFIMHRNIKKLKKIFYEYNVDVVHAYSRAPAWSVSRAVDNTRVKLVTGCHSAHKISGEAKRFYNSSITKGELVIAASHFLKAYLIENYSVDPNKIRVIHRGVPLESFHPNSVTPERLINVANEFRVPDGTTVILFPSRLTRLKGHMFFLKSLNTILRNEAIKDQEIFCLFVGGSDKKSGYKQELTTFIEENGMGSNVRMVDYCSDMPAAYMLANVVVAPSIVPEGFGRIAVEAQAMGRPIIATRHGGSMETIIEDKTGWLVEPDNLEELSGALLEALLLDQRQRGILGTRGMIHVANNFTIDNMCSHSLDVYAELLS